MKCAHPRAPSPAPRSHTEEEERTEGVLNPTRRVTCRARFLDRSLLCGTFAAMPIDDHSQEPGSPELRSGLALPSRRGSPVPRFRF